MTYSTQKGNRVPRTPRHFAAVALCWMLLAGAGLGRAQTVSVWLTTDDQTKKLQSQSPVSFSTASGGTNPIYVDENQTYQTIEGFGASFTDTTGYNLNEVATPTARLNAMTNLFTLLGGGIGLSFVRNPMGGCDLSRTQYSYDDTSLGQPDPSLSGFSIAHDQADIIPLVQKALQLNPKLKIMANPWSPPGWMKTSGSMVTGSLLTGATNMSAPFANYIVKYIQAYQAAGIPIHYISLQNEPLYEPSDYPGMYMDATTQLQVLRDYVLPALTSNGLTSKVLVYDHNWDRPDYPATEFSDPTILASSQVAGIAWHGYGGSPGVMLGAASQYPTKGNYLTEHSGGTWVSDQVRADFEEITHVMRAWGKAYVKWNLAGDQNYGPHDGGCGTCTPLVIVNTTSGGVSYGIEYYTLGHFSKFVLPGAYRVYSANANGVISAAFVNPDGSKALVAYNDTPGSQTFQVQWGGKSFSYTLASFAGATFTWTGTQSGTYSVNAANQIQASSFNSVSGLQTEPTSDYQGGFDVGYTYGGAYAVYQNVNLGAGYSNVTVRVASGGNGGNVEFRLDSPTGLRIGNVAVTNTGGWQTWQSMTGSISGGSGVHHLYVVFTGNNGIANLNWFQFGGALAPASPSALTAQAQDRQVVLNWAPVVGAASYNIKRASGSSGYNQVANVTATTYTNTGLLNGTAYNFVVSALNSAGESANSSPALATPTNHPPTLSAIADQTVLAGRTLSVSNYAGDSDLPPQTLTFSLLSAPSGAAINATNGWFTWRPTIAQSPATQTVNVVVTDSGVPAQSATQSFNVTILKPIAPTLELASAGAGQFGFRVSGDQGPDYTILVSTDLLSWSALATSNSPTLPWSWAEPFSTAASSRFYRASLGP